MASHSKPSLLTLPGELRNDIWRRLHILPELHLAKVAILGHHLLRNHISTNSLNLLYVCRQTYNEASNVLYGENCVGFIFSAEGINCSLQVNDAAVMTGSDLLVCPLEKMRRVSISVKMTNQDDHPDILSFLRQTLPRFPALQKVHIVLTLSSVVEGSVTRILEPLTLLRSVKAETFNVQPKYAEYLKSIIEGKEPPGQFSRMYRALQLYTSIDLVEPLLQKACDAMEDGHLEKFKKIRGYIVSRVRLLRGSSKGGLYDHDALDAAAGQIGT